MDRLGADLQDVTKARGGRARLESPHGAKLVKLQAGEPAEKAGLLPDDILLSLDGMEIENKAGFIAAVSGKALGAEIKFRLLRGGKEKRLAVTLGGRPVEQARGEAKDAPILQLDTGGHMSRSGASPSRRTATSSCPPARIRSSASGIGARARRCAPSRAIGTGCRTANLRTGDLARWPLARGRGTARRTVPGPVRRYPPLRLRQRRAESAIQGS